MVIKQFRFCFLFIYLVSNRSRSFVDFFVPSLNPATIHYVGNNARIVIILPPTQHCLGKFIPGWPIKKPNLDYIQYPHPFSVVVPWQWKKPPLTQSVSHYSKTMTNIANTRIILVKCFPIQLVELNCSEARPRNAKNAHNNFYSTSQLSPGTGTSTG